MTARRLAAAVVALSLVVLASACGTGSTNPPASTGTTGTTATTGSTATTGGSSSTTAVGPTTSTTLTDGGFPPGTVLEPVPGTSVPREDPKQPIRPDVQSGNNALIEPTALWPALLYANVRESVVWTNESGRPQTIVFDHIPVRSSAIPPGGQFVWKAHFPGSYTYHTTSGLHAVLDLVNPAFS